MAPSKACRADLGRSLHDDKAGPLQMLHKPLRCDCGHILVGLTHTLAALKAQREGERVG